jgi:hypothetical protein
MITFEKRQARKKQTAEYFTPSELSNTMLDKLPREVWKKGKTYLDPACGNGNILVLVLERKITKYKHNPIEALKTIYGVDLMPDNVIECQVRLLEVISKHQTVTDEHYDIVFNNIVCHDALTYNFDFKPKRITAWQKRNLNIQYRLHLGLDVPKEELQEHYNHKYTDEEKENLVKKANEPRL